jgi:hypothetical protein
MSLNQIILIMVIFQVKHFIADYPLQTIYMVNGKALPDRRFILPLSLHAGIHALSTLVVVLFYNTALWWLAPLDFAIHFATDRFKSSPIFFGRFSDPKKAMYWSVFGVDQMIHHLTHIYLAYVIIVNTL